MAGAYLNGTRAGQVRERDDLQAAFMAFPQEWSRTRRTWSASMTEPATSSIGAQAPVPLQADVTYIVSVQAQDGPSPPEASGAGAPTTPGEAPGHPGETTRTGFGTGREHFTRLLTCIRSDEGPDFAFALYNNLVAAGDQEPRGVARGALPNLVRTGRSRSG